MKLKPKPLILAPNTSRALARIVRAMLKALAPPRK